MLHCVSRGTSVCRDKRAYQQAEIYLGVDKLIVPLKCQLEGYAQGLQVYKTTSKQESWLCNTAAEARCTLLK